MGDEPAVEAAQVEQAASFAGDPDGFERLWTPHRLAYIKGDRKPSDPDDSAQCPFCRAPGLDDAEGLVVHRGRTAFVVLNLFPYNPGHLLVCPYRHVSSYVDLRADELAEFTALTRAAVLSLQAASNPAGFNLGMNQGGVAGAGIAAHLHQHVVPRWEGDANFLPVVARTKALPELLEDTRRRVAAAWTTAEPPA
ncbi:HIT family protein [Kineococcus rubinsiae]|uniref:HIT family protein n=1 Tax=Kineococcus rubinsiae TaxID=2609562 RepID=UPI00142F9EC1|nr:HIT domain-containing protein [Kineococcus rubinsiae]